MGKERIVYNRHTMADEIKIEETDYIDVVVETCSRIICYEYNNELCR